jgi:hypothetical protein
MLSWRGAADGTTGIGRVFILLLLDDVRIIHGATPETAFDQQAMQLNKRRYRDARHADLHRSTGNRIQHPCGHHRDYAGRRLDMDKSAGDAPLAVMSPDTTPIEGVPTVIDLNFLPDMGRMTGRLPWAENRGCSPAPTAAAIGRRSCTP